MERCGRGPHKSECTISRILFVEDVLTFGIVVL
jgi:hypothetical protein